MSASLRSIILLLAATAAVLAPAAPILGRNTTELPGEISILMAFQRRSSSVSVREMEREANQILRPFGYRLNWLPQTQDPHRSYTRVAVLNFRGACEFDPSRSMRQEPGPYALMHVTDGQVMPYGEVYCDKVAAAVQAALSGHGFSNGDQLLGRALGRVVAHELVHLITQSTQHASEGVEKSALSAKQLVQPELVLHGSFAPADATN